MVWWIASDQDSTNYWQQWLERIKPNKTKFLNKLIYLLWSCSMCYYKRFTLLLTLGLLQCYSIITQYYLYYTAEDIRRKSDIKPKRKKILKSAPLLSDSPPFPTLLSYELLIFLWKKEWTHTHTHKIIIMKISFCYHSTFARMPYIS